MPAPRIRSKRETLRELLLAGMRDGQHPPGSRLPSEWSLVRSHGVSRDTAHAVLAGLARDGLVERRRGSGTRVAADAARRLATVPAVLRVALLLPPDRLANPIFQGILAAFHARLDERAAVTVQLRRHPDPAALPPADLLIVDGNYPRELLAALAVRQPRLVLLNGLHPDLPCVCTDNRQGGVLIARHALALGHRRIAVVHYGERDTEQEFIQRLRGMRHALRAAGCEPFELKLDLARLPDFDAVGWMRQLRRGRWLPSAMLCPTDLIALYALELLAAEGLGGIGVTGFDDLPVSGLVHPGLTTMRQPVERLGELLAEAVDAVLAGRPLLRPRPVPPALVARTTLRSV